MKRVYIFDLDGTLCDTIDSLLLSVNMTMDRMGFPYITKQQCRAFVGNGARVLVEKSLQTTGVPTAGQVEEALAIYLEVFDEHCADGVVPYPGMMELIRELKQRGAMLACLSNKPDPQTLKVVERVFGKGTFDYIQGQRGDIKRKPDPEGVCRILEAYHCDKEDCLYIGDSEVDIRTGHNAGVPTLGVTWGFRTKEELKSAGAKLFADHPGELLAIE